MHPFPRTAGLAGIVAIGLSGCVITDPSQNTTTENAALIGAAVGGVIGATRPNGNRVVNTVVGAGIGAAAGGVIGQLLEKQHKRLREDLGDDVRIVNTGSELVVTMPQDILFDSGSAVLRPDLRGNLAKLAANLNEFPDSTIDIIGHTDNTGPASLNQELSAERARAVRDVLADNGVDWDRMRAFGRGEDEPVATNLTEEGKAQNRRVDIIIRPTG